MSESTLTFELPVNMSGVFEATPFVAREDELKRVEEILEGTRKSGMAVLHGSGGIGKTQLAIAYTRRHTINVPRYPAAI